ncbi:AAA family ATPase [Shewanella sp. CG12_big_fil_rev_8_21_14_0_65_47_15]|uniref:AAA family ATPase n=1 Tax=Shewanella sp. CG12_big_fil_rev_8_21_14_0_65_47_15 TaxID=1975537 RepID=UPI000CBF67D9|nr:AAA family ATPase [Shewanella sp. CG12_big_fil_rev_8_21_14_0_65_47_15]PIW61627.1 MAG: ATPase [Shewanella sp. CG12_big_fil_rev_8_21_14_0_65_47_15]
MQDIRDLTSVLRSNTPIVVIETYEEYRVVELLKRVANVLYQPVFTWSITQGLARVDKPMAAQKFNSEPTDLLGQIKSTPQKGIYVLCDFHPFVIDAPKNVRLLKEIALEYETLQHTLVLVSHAFDIPPEIKRYCAYFQLTLPSTVQLQNLIYLEVDNIRNQGTQLQVDDTAVTKLAENLRGVTLDDARRLVRKAIVDDGAITSSDIDALNKAKFQLLDLNGVLQFEYDTSDFSEIAGLHNLKKWLKQRAPIAAVKHDTGTANTNYVPKVLDIPKGILLLGVQGSGKSLAAKAVAGVWQRPLLRLDMAALYNKYIGETEKNLRNALALADMMSPCVLWIDEIEKGLSGGSSDEGTSTRILGTLLTWMAERKSDVFVVATANDIQALPPELMRKGRMDEIFFVDLPDEAIRKAIFLIHCQRRGIDVASLDLAQLSARSQGFSGAEIEQAVIAAIYTARSVERGVDQALLLEELSKTRPLSVVMSDKINALRQWAAGRTVNAHE